MKRKLLKIFKRTLLVVFIAATLISTFTFFYMKHAKFGKSPDGQRLLKIQQSPNYKNGKFVNKHHTPEISEGYTMLGVAFEYLFHKKERLRPVDSIPSVKTDLLHLAADTDILVWFGHSSYFIQIDGKRILVDPVFSGNASPLPGTVKAFKGADRYTVEDLPDIDYLFISHDHYDHVDYETIAKLKTKVKKVICGLGVGAHFEYWGYDPNIIMEKDWDEKIELDHGFVAYTTPGRHFSGRGLNKCNTLWVSYVLQTPSMKLFIGGDSGYDTHFAEIGEKYGPMDLAILENGQYDEKWKYIHMLPYQVLQAAKDLKAARLLPVHSSKFVLGNHAWDEPLTTITELNSKLETPLPLVTPMIGQPVYLKDKAQTFSPWWKQIH